MQKFIQYKGATCKKNPERMMVDWIGFIKKTTFLHWKILCASIEFMAYFAYFIVAFITFSENFMLIPGKAK